mmetsp:Transcript_44098/g.127530  ORF Transcript_44098/g.127530 Transcript_44098/m.127530 type:complete len:215 (-) Transcript_44098:1411-2055(-)
MATPPLPLSTAVPSRRKCDTTASSAAQCNKQLGRNRVHCASFDSVGPMGRDTWTCGGLKPSCAHRLFTAWRQSCSLSPPTDSSTTTGSKEARAASPSGVHSCLSGLAAVLLGLAPPTELEELVPSKHETSNDTADGLSRWSPVLCIRRHRPRRPLPPARSPTCRTLKLPSSELAMMRLSVGTAFRTCSCRAAARGPASMMCSGTGRVAASPSRP